MKILVTGAAGFIGSHLVEHLLAAGHQVVGLDNFDPYYPATIKWANLKAALDHPAFQLVEADIRAATTVQDLFAQGDFNGVIHLAAKAGVRPSIEQTLDYVGVNVDGTAVLLEAARHHGVKRFLFASSSSVYGNQVKVPFAETDDVGFPISPYAATKRAGELLCHTYHHLFGLEIACMRFFTVYGPRQRPDLAIHKFTHLGLMQQPIQIYGDGSTRRDYTYVDDIVAGILALLLLPQLGFEIVNIGNGQPVDLLDMVAAVEKALGRPVEKQFTGMQPGDVDQTYADVRKAKQLCGYQPSTTLEQGVARFLAWYQQQEGSNH